MPSQLWVAAHAARYARLKPVYFGDDLVLPPTHLPGRVGHRRAFPIRLPVLFVCQPDSRPTIEEYRTGIPLDERTEKVRRGRKWTTYRYQWLRDVPPRGDAGAMNVTWLIIEIRNDSGTVTYRNSFVTDLPVNRENVAELAACGRARWMIENKAFNTLKTKGYNLEHNFGHGRQNLSTVVATLNLLAFTRPTPLAP